MSNPKIYVALPLMDEADYLPGFLESLRKQTCPDFVLVACVNQPDQWWEDPGKRHVCLNNRRTLEMLRAAGGFEKLIIDRSSPGLGWTGKHFGVGWARKMVMDAASDNGSDRDIIVSLDGDTTFEGNYLDSIVRNVLENPDIACISVPYYHKLTGDEPADRAILRYEIYMRYFLLNLLRIRNPYAFSALGSAIALTLKSYRRVGGITPFRSGEDFYFVQKLAKSAPVSIWNEEIVYPASRFSDRVFFGTGPAMIKGAKGDWNSYPVYDHQDFNKVEHTFDRFAELWERDLPTPMDDFLKVKFKTENVWDPLRLNYKSRGQFVNACIRKVDGLRILQFLKENHIAGEKNSMQALRDFISEHYPGERDLLPVVSSLAKIETASQVRDRLFELEMRERERVKFVGIK